MFIKPSIPRVLQFFGPSPRGHVRHGSFWTPSVNLGVCMWEAWIKAGPNNAATYWLSDGYGGKHASLYGSTQIVSGGVMLPSGNMWTGSTTVAWLADEGYYPGEWVHAAFIRQVDPATGQIGLFCHLNGIPVGRVTHNGTRQSGAIVADGCCDLLIGGSDHSNFEGLIAMVRGFENFCPLTYPRLGFAPENAFGMTSYDGNGTYTDCAFLASYMGGESLVPDLSPRGFDGNDFTDTLRFHHGALFGCGNLGINRGIPAGGVSTFPRPQYVYDPTCPVGSSTLIVPTLDVPTASPVPVGARIFDGFDRQQQNFAWQAEPSLGSTDDGASLGALAWTTRGITAAGVASPVFGIRSGRAVSLAASLGAIAEVDNGSATMDVRVSRLAGVNGVNETGIAFRVQDRDNFWFAYPISDGAAIRVGGFAGSSPYTEPSNGDSAPAFNGYSTAAAPNWTRLRVVASGTTFTIYVGEASGAFDANNFPLYTWTQVGQLTGQTVHQTATKCGIAGIPYSTLSNMLRYDDFEVQ